MKKKIVRNRLIAIVVVLALAITLVQLPKPQSTGGVAHAEGDGTKTRGVVNELKELPQFYNPDYLQLSYGTPERPFVVLEIVPYPELAEFGYLISGCEPVDLESMRGDGQMMTLDKRDGFWAAGYQIYFFPDEWNEEIDSVRFAGLIDSYTPTNLIAGYFEKVPVGEGTFKYTYVNEGVSANAINATMLIDDEQPSVNAEPVTDEQQPTDSSEPSADGQQPTDSSEPSADGQQPTDSSEPSADEQPPVSNGDVVYAGSTLSLVIETDENADFEQFADTDLDVFDENVFDTLEQSSQNASTDEMAEVDSSSDDTLQADSGETDTNSEGNIEDGEGSGELNTEDDIDSNEAQTLDITSYDMDIEALALEDQIAQWTVTIEVATNGDGDLKWHSLSTYYFDYSTNQITNIDGATMTDLSYRNGKLQYTDLDNAPTLDHIGARLYTYREKESGEDVKWIKTYYEYDNLDLFLTQSLRVSEDLAETYPIVIKTITPDELNKDLRWVDYADLIVISPQSHDTGLVATYLKQNGKEQIFKDNIYPKNGFENNDLSAEAVLKIYNKVTADTNFAAIILDETLYESSEVVTSQTKKNVTITVHDWNMRVANEGSISFAASCNNIYKLYVMLLAMDSNLFKKLYLSGDSPIIQIQRNGDQEDLIVTNQTGDATKYWDVRTFLLVSPASNSWTEWISDELWNNYHSTSRIADEPFSYWTNEHVFTYPGSKSIAQDYNSGEGVRSGNDGTMFDDFYGFLDEEKRNNAHTADAVRYILGAGKNNSNFGQGLTLNILDLEPSVGLNSDGTPDWYLTPTYVRMLLPHFSGDVTITHQTTAEFIGKAEDLNAKYQMIFMGLDSGAYNTSYQSYQKDDGTWTGGYLPDWNDNSLDGLIYLHTGDKMYSTEYVASSRTRSVNWLWGAKLGVDSGDALVNQLLRFPGNDISLLKKADLEEFLAAGYPVVMESNLYNLEKKMIDQSSYVYAFVNESKSAGKTVYNVSTPTAIENAVRNTLGASVIFTTLPKTYNGTTADGSAAITNPNYLDTDSGRPYLPFGFNVSESGYSYRIYVDQNRNSKFEDDEIILTRSADVGANSYSYRIASSWVGLVQWKIEVYKTNNPAIRYVQTGCSAVRNTSGTRKEVRVLQIMPKEIGASGYKGSLNLEQSNLFKTYYKDLVDYDIKIHTITWDEYAGYFEDSGFAYNYMEEADDLNNPVNLDQVGGDLANYHMIIMGFGDTYGGVNLSNENGEVDYLRYFLDQGKSILFTHDLTSLYALPYNGNQIFGYTVNATMRDLMGMNRYRAISDQANAVERERLRAYQAEHASDYDSINSVALHGYTYYSMKRLGFTDNSTNPNDSYGYKVPYKYMITNPAGLPVVQGNSSGFNNNNDLTTRATKVNEGQITVYPYLIDDTLPISPTHGQWYQLAPEDAEVTVWYALTGDDTVNWSDPKGSGTDGSTITYAVSPNDTMNNYYIYSKGNIFYSGVGHSTVDGVMEAKLFINTMIAAYNSGYEPPVIEIVNDEAVLQSAQQYSIELLQNFDELVSDYYGSNITYTDADTYPVKFMPVDFNLVTTQLECTIQLADGVYIDEIETEVNGVPVTLHADAEHKFVGINNGQVYTLQYPKKYLYDWTDAAGVTHTEMRAITFSIKNNRVKASNSTILNMSLQPLFPLD